MYAVHRWQPSAGRTCDVSSTALKTTWFLGLRLKNWNRTQMVWQRRLYGDQSVIFQSHSIHTGAFRSWIAPCAVMLTSYWRRPVQPETAPAGERNGCSVSEVWSFGSSVIWIVWSRTFQNAILQCYTVIVRQHYGWFVRRRAPFPRLLSSEHAGDQRRIWWIVERPQ
jgi:hypothetical protein